MYLTMDTKYAIIELYLKSMYEKSVKPTEDKLKQLGDEIYKQLFSDYLLMIEMLPSCFFMTDTSMRIETDKRVYYIRLSNPRFVPFYSFHKFDISPIQHLFDEYFVLRNEFKSLQAQINGIRQRMNTQTRGCKSKKSFLTTYPELDKFYEQYFEQSV